MRIKRKLTYGIGFTAIIIGIIAVLLPSILHSLGFHPDYESKEYNFSGRKF